MLSTFEYKMTYANKEAKLLSHFSVQSSVFNVGQYRRDAAGSYNSFEFFRPDNAEAMKIRKYANSALMGNTM